MNSSENYASRQQAVRDRAFRRVERLMRENVEMATIAGVVPALTDANLGEFERALWALALAGGEDRCLMFAIGCCAVERARREVA